MTAVKRTGKCATCKTQALSISEALDILDNIPDKFITAPVQKPKAVGNCSYLYKTIKKKVAIGL